MTKRETIKRLKTQVLYAFYTETKFAKTAKVPMKSVQKKFRSDLRGFVKFANLWDVVLQFVLDQDIKC